MIRRTTLVVCGLICFLLVAAPALAGKRSPRGGAGGTISLVQLNPSPGGPYFGDQVTFTVSTTATAEPWVNVNCYQNGTRVYGQWRGFFDRYQYGQIFTLGPTPSWTGGAAECTAKLVKRDNARDKTLATTSFHVAA